MYKNMYDSVIKKLSTKLFHSRELNVFQCFFHVE